MSEPSGSALGAGFDRARMHRERHDRLVGAAREAGFDAAVLLGQGNVGYSTGTRVVAADQARAIHRRPVALVATDGAAPHVWTWYPDGAPDWLPPEHVHPGVDLESDDGAQALLDALPSGAIAVDETTMPLRAALRDAGRAIVDVGSALGAAKAVKTPDELACIRHAQAINEAAIDALLPHVVPGVTGVELTGRFLEAIVGLGATNNNVDPIWQTMPSAIADGPWSATGDLVFPLSSDATPFAEGDVVWVDNGLAFEGYMSDYGHTWIVGHDPDARQRDQARRWRELVDTVLGVVRAGATARDLTRAALGVDPAGRRPWLPHLYLAHGSGTESAEPPFIGTDLGDAFDETVVLEAGNVIVLEPVIWDDAHAGFRAEQIVTVTDDGWLPLSHPSWAGWGLEVEPGLEAESGEGGS